MHQAGMPREHPSQSTAYLLLRATPVQPSTAAGKGRTGPTEA
jgi:hypothetical protein